ncbi:MAG: phage tail tape measure protein [Dehalococcoidales bacterium]|nr:phage tail tape measure protein [Dehalococcoidales bacterium]
MASILEILIRATDQTKEAFDGISDRLGSMSKGFKVAGGIAAGAGAAITGTMALCVKSAAEEEAGIMKLSQALKNVGINYDEVKGSLEGVISATQTKTSVADDAQREALQALVEITGDYNKSLDLLALTLDMSVAMNIDAATAADLVGKVAAGNTAILSRYGIVLKEGATATEALGALQSKYGGQAEAYGQTMSGQMALLKNNIGDLMESIGGQLIPILTDFFQNNLQPIIEKVKSWIGENPNLVRTITIVTSVVGAVLIPLGSLLLLLPQLVTGIKLVGLALNFLATNPVGLIITAIAALIAIGILLWQNWDTVCAKAKEIWEAIAKFFTEVFAKIKDAFLTTWNAIKDFFVGLWNRVVDIFKNNWDKIVAILFPVVGIPLLISRNWDAIKGYFTNLWENVKNIFTNAWEKIASTARSVFLRVMHFIYDPIKTVVDLVIQGINGMIGALNNIPGVNISPITWTMPSLPAYQLGGVVRETGLAYVHKDETILPQGANITIPIALDGEPIATYIIDLVAKKARLQGAY